jgi:hypothetical protein
MSRLRFRDALVWARRLAMSLPADDRIITINVRKEWGEGRHLEPDTVQCPMIPLDDQR